MSLPKGYHIQMVVCDNAGNLVKILPISVASDVKVDPTKNDSVSNAIENIQELVNALGDLAFVDEIESATTEKSGVVKLSNVIDDTTKDDTAATTAAVSTVNENSVHTSGEESVNGMKDFIDGLGIDGSKLTSETVNGDKILTLEI